MPLRGTGLICSFSFKELPVSWDDFGVGRAKHSLQSFFSAPISRNVIYTGRCGQMGQTLRGQSHQVLQNSATKNKIK